MDEPRSSDTAEYRLVTVMFADVVGSTAMGERLGAETYRLIMDRSLRRLNRAIHAFGGTVHRLMGDGLLAFFGAPQAHEDDPIRAALAALRIHESIGSYAQELGQPLQVRVGINTGRVVMGAMGDEIFSEYTGMGTPVNLAARLESEAAPGHTLVGETTARLIEHQFELAPAGPFTLKGISEPAIAFELVAELAQPADARGLAFLHSPLVGRAEEQRQLNDLLQGLEAGRGAVCTLIAEPGIGKSRLLQEVREEHAGRNIRWAIGRAHSYSQNQPFGLIIDLLNDLLGLAIDDAPAIIDLKLEQVLTPLLGDSIDQAWPYLANLLGAPLPPQYEADVKQLPPAQLNSRISNAVQQTLEALAAESPLALAFEDLHWSDQSSLSLIKSSMLSTERRPLLLVLLFRPERTKPVWELKLHAETEFAHRYVELTLKSLDADASQLMVENLLQTTDVPYAVRQVIQHKAEGNPFFVEELVRDLTERKVLVRRGRRWEMAAETGTMDIPETVEGVIQARLDRLSPAERETLQAASVIGRQFGFALLNSISGEDSHLSQHLLQLQRADLIREWTRFPELEYGFKHTLVQETTYRTLLDEQKKTLHRQVARQLMILFPDRSDEYAARLARHFEGAGSVDKAIDYLLRAGMRAARLGSIQEAGNHLQRGLEMLRELPKSPRNERRELELLTAYGASLVPVLGYNSEQINATFRRVHLLSQRLGVAMNGPVLRYLAISSLFQADFLQTFTYGQKLLELAERDQDNVSRVEGYYAQGVASYWQGHWIKARHLLTQAIKIYDPRQQDVHLSLYSQDPRVVCLSRLAVVLWYLGYPVRAARANQDAVALARKLAHPNSLGIALTWTAWLHHLSWNTKAALKQSEEAIAFSQQENLVFWLTINTLIKGWALIQQNETEEGLGLMEKGLTSTVALNAKFVVPYFRSLQASTWAKMREFGENYSEITNNINLLEQSGERWCLPEMHRLRADLLLTQGKDPAKIEESYFQAIELAREQKARAMELRATTELCQFWQQQGKQQEARQMLAGIYNWYSEGFEQAELKKARIVLDSLVN